MGINLQAPRITELKPRITVIGVGGAGGNAVANMIATGLEGVEFIVANTDAQALAMSVAERRLQLGKNLTEGLGAGAKPDIGQAAAEEAIEEIRAELEGSHMIFLAAGMGGGTGTGAIPVIARIARELGILTVGIVTKPFHFEGSRRMRVAEDGIAQLAPEVDTLIVIPNQNLFHIASEKTSFAQAFVLADQILYSGIACIVDLMVKEGLINLDFADVKAVMQGMGAAMMGTGEAGGENRAVEAAEQAIANPLLDDVSLQGAQGLLISIVGGREMSLYDVDAAASRVKMDINPEANIIVGASFDETLGERMRVSIVASGMEPAPSQQISAAQQGRKANPPALPQQPGSQPAAGGDPYMGQCEPSDFAEVLSAAVGHVDAEGGENSQAEEDGHAEGARSGAWEASEGVTVEEVSPTLPRRNAPPPLPESMQQPTDHAAGGDFTAAQPHQVQDGIPRIPDIAEFPEVGQRDYYAKQDAPGSSDNGGLMHRLERTLSGTPAESVARNTVQNERSDDGVSSNPKGERSVAARQGSEAAAASKSDARSAQRPEKRGLFGGFRR